MKRWLLFLIISIISPIILSAQPGTITVQANAIDGRPWQGIAYYFTPGKSELLPFDQAAIAAYQGKLTQNPGY
ncbi:MAG: hypothetical protein ABIN01_03875 [Ferruginibacter sp.]